MLKNKRGFTLVELLAVIVVLAVVMVLATTTILPYMSTAREDAFRIEATYIVQAGENALNVLNLGQINVDGDENSCVKGKTYCFTVKALVDKGLYDADNDNYVGKLIIGADDPKNVSYTLWLNKVGNFNIIEGTATDYNQKNVPITNGTWSESYEKCECN